MNAIGLFDYWIIAIAALFVIVNPLTTAFMFVSLLPRTSETTRKAVAKRSSLIATGVLPYWVVLFSTYLVLPSRHFVLPVA